MYQAAQVGIHFGVSTYKSHWGVGSEAQWFGHLLPDPTAVGLIPSVPKKISEELLLMLLRLNESGQWLENVD